MTAIDDFSGEYDFLSNFYPCAIVFDGHGYPSTEHAFQAAKTHDAEQRARIRAAKSPAQAKKFGRRVPLRADWESVKIDVMRELLRQKFSFPDLRARLLATGDRQLVEGNWWGDRFWGVCRGRGGELARETADGDQGGDRHGTQSERGPMCLALQVRGR